MSIIHEALKKVQDNLDRLKDKTETLEPDQPSGSSDDAQTTPPTATNPSPPETQTRSSHPRWTFPSASQSVQDPTATVMTGPPTERGHDAPHTSPQRHTTAFPSLSLWLAGVACLTLGVGLILLVMLYTATRPASDGRTVKGLEGVAQVNGVTVALINGEMYRVGDVYEGKEIVAIRWNEVILKDPSGKIHRLQRIGRPHP